MRANTRRHTHTFLNKMHFKPNQFSFCFILCHFRWIARQKANFYFLFTHFIFTFHVSSHLFVLFFIYFFVAFISSVSGCRFLKIIYLFCVFFYIFFFLLINYLQFNKQNVRIANFFCSSPFLIDFNCN